MEDRKLVLQRLKDKRLTYILVEVALGGCVLIAMTCLMLRINLNNHLNDWKKHTAPIPTGGVTLLCNTFELENETICLNNQPVYQDELTSVFQDSYGRWKKHEKHITYSDTEKYLKPYRTGCTQLSSEFFRCGYQFNGNYSSGFLIEYSYSNLEVITIHFYVSSNPDYL